MRLRHLATTTLVLAVGLAGCSVTINEEGFGEDGGGDAAADGAGGGNSGDNTGVISVSGAATGPDGEAIQAVIDLVNEDSEFEATYSGSDSFEQEIVIQVEGGTPPDLAFFPQPGAVIEQAQQGNAIALEDLGLDIAQLEERFGEYMMSLGEYEGKHYGIPDTINFKSAVWYSPPAFEAAGYTIPETWEDMIALSDQIVADGKAPWCLGTGSDAATGWPATDWMEDVVLRTAGTEAYDQWVAGELPFASPEISGAAERFGEILFAEGYVLGGHENVSSIDFRDAPDPMFDDDPKCYLHRQATFIANFFPEGLTPMEDYDFFEFPTIDGNEGVLMAGGLSAAFSDRPEIREFIEKYTAADVQCQYGKEGAGSNISANIEVGPDCYDNELIAQTVDPLTTALREGNARFDGSDLMPPAVGSGSFWTGMNAYTDNGPDNLQQVMEDIDSSWPAS